jgi:YHS domain-containing protein
MVWFLIRLILIVILFLLLKRLWDSLSGAVRKEGGLPPRSESSPQALVHDPECGLHLPLGDALTVYHERGTLYFCSRECRDAYLAKLQHPRE